MAQTRAKSPFQLNRGIENRYAMRLRGLAAKIGRLVTGYSDPLNDGEQRFRIQQALTAYADQITPWAQALAGRVVREIDWANRKAFAEHSAEMSRTLRRELENAPTGEMMRFMRAEQVQLIRSLPLEAAERVQEIALKNLTTTGLRADSLAKEIQRTGDVTKSRATLIARTETSRTSSNLTQARAIYVGSVEYTWETAEDSDVRPSHARMQDQVVQWASPPTLDGLRGHAGCLPNCRCHPAPIIPPH
jgi:SPP1 gp7 family putative phage head morphogenesis protein